MVKVKVIHEDGYSLNGTKHEKGDLIDHPTGPKLDAALHFKQVEVVKEAPSTAAKK